MIKAAGSGLFLDGLLFIYQTILSSLFTIQQWIIHAPIAIICDSRIPEKSGILWQTIGFPNIQQNTMATGMELEQLFMHN